MKFEAILFDCDGVLVDSELISNRVLTTLINEIGIALSLDEVMDQFMGRSMRHCLATLAQLRGSVVPEDFATNYHLRTTAAFQNELTLIPGIEAVLDALCVPSCVASSGNHAKMRTTLGITGLLSRFEGRLFSVTEVAHAKPAPDVFLHAAQRCGVPPRACLVIEDSPAGVIAGIAAGMTVYGFATRTPAERLHSMGAHRVFDDMKQLPALIALGIP